MKKCLMILNAFALCLLQSTLFAAAKKTTPPPEQKNPPEHHANWLKDQDDQTDTYAIPLDSSEAEENQEMEELDRAGRRKHVPHQTSP